MDKKLVSIEIYNRLKKLIPDGKCELNYSSNFQLLVAVILSAQCTDIRVNKVTEKLFEDYGTPQAIANMDIIELEKYIKSCGFYHNKAKNIIAMSKSLLEKFDGQVPIDLEELVTLAGVGRKTANVVMCVAFNKNAIPVDTHVFRVSNRLGLANAKNPIDCEKQLKNNIEEKYWNEFTSKLLLLFGRYYCKAQNPKCQNCVVKEYCKYYKEQKDVSR